MAALNLAILVSGRGSNMEAIINAIQDKRLNAEIVVVLSDNKEAPALKKAKNAGIAAKFVDPLSFNREEYGEKLLQELQPYKIDLVVLAGFMRILGKTFLKAFSQRVVNIHPSLLPSFPGLDAQRQALEYGVKYSGCTVHFVDEGVDTGPIIDQVVVPVKADDTVESLSSRILKEEHRLYPQVLQKISEGRVKVKDRRVQIL
ncbi:MAG: phosphoribosylglycinamide formyltransferase 1 [Clostridia bacterium]|jgi:phosphoribosylglycinamide formyltransferase-1|nr:phosphoribosylglycinamide formyltransferase [Clostridiales bacterium]MDK2985962.1 phosphoribosylglycinamide formyltransferase 1 [Clostridia bacterium]